MNVWKASTIALALALGVVVGGNYVVPAFAGEPPQPHMHNALNHLKEARAELMKASSDKGGHRVAAIKLTDDAIDQVKKGIAFDKTH